MQIAVIVNRKAGSVVNGKVSAESLRQSFLEMGTEAEIHVIPGERIIETARRAVAGGADVVVAGGGDGTIRTVASVLVGGEVPLGVLPLGSLNHFARDLKIPMEVEGAIRVILEGKVHGLDVGDVNGEIFLNNSSLGFYPPIVQARDQEMRRTKHNKWVATAIATFKLLPKLSSLHVRISSGDWQVERRTELVFVGNCEYQMSALNHGAPNRLESGYLYLYLARGRSRLHLIGLALAGLVRDIKQTRSVEDWRLPELEIEVRWKGAIPVAFDGEVSTMKSPLHYRKRLRSLRVMLPPAEEGEVSQG
jgi:diacylglycerol kinase family enzyme